MKKDIKIIQVCFNLADPFQRLLYQYIVKYPNRSGYVKRILQRDYDRQKGV